MFNINGICISTGAACWCNDWGSYVIKNMGYSEEINKNLIRFSFGKDCIDNLEYLLKIFNEIILKCNEFDK